MPDPQKALWCRVSKEKSGAILGWKSGNMSKICLLFPANSDRGFPARYQRSFVSVLVSDPPSQDRQTRPTV